MDLLKSRDFREYLQNELQTRNSRNSRYSLRAFSKHLEVDSSRLSKMLKGLRPIHAQLIESMGQKLGLHERQITEFKKGTVQPYRKNSAYSRPPTLVIASNPEKIEEAMIRIQQFTLDIAKFLEDTETTTHLYHLDLNISLADPSKEPRSK